MGVTGAYQHSYTVDLENKLNDAGLKTASAAGTVGGSAKILDFGSTDVNSVENIAFTRGDLLVDLLATEHASGDEVCLISFELSDDTSGGGTGFAAGDVVVSRGILGVANVEITPYLFNLNMDPNDSTGRLVLGVDNMVMGTLYRYARVAAYIYGTLATGFSYEAWFVEKK